MNLNLLALRCLSSYFRHSTTNEELLKIFVGPLHQVHDELRGSVAGHQALEVAAGGGDVRVRALVGYLRLDLGVPLRAGNVRLDWEKGLFERLPTYLRVDASKKSGKENNI